MKPFNLEKALAGEPVLTRDGRAVTQLHKFNIEKAYPLRAVLDGEVVAFAIDGASSLLGESSLDLFMAEPERWVNVYWNDRHGIYNGAIYNSEEQAKQEKKDGLLNSDIYQTTIKIK